MKNVKNTIKSVLLIVVLTAVFGVYTGVSVFAEPDETYAIESFVAEETTEENEEETEYIETEGTEAYEVTEEVVTEEPEYTEAPVYEEETTLSGESEAETQTAEAETSASAEVTVTEKATEPSYRAPLPTLENNEIIPPEVVGATDEKNEPALFWGFVSWILIGVGIAVIFAVVLSTKAKGYRGGRDRYSSTDKISGKKKLLPQDYYDKRKRR